jgi:hypothetical protein
MDFELDHLFICVSASGPEADRLAGLGLTEGGPTRTPCRERPAAASSSPTPTWSCLGCATPKRPGRTRPGRRGCSGDADQRRRTRVRPAGAFPARRQEHPRRPAEARPAVPGPLARPGVRDEPARRGEGPGRAGRVLVVRLGQLRLPDTSGPPVLAGLARLPRPGFLCGPPSSWRLFIAQRATPLAVEWLPEGGPRWANAAAPHECVAPPVVRSVSSPGRRHRGRPASPAGGPSRPARTAQMRIR